jgi:type I restriction enzyme M protein
MEADRDALAAQLEELEEEHSGEEGLLAELDKITKATVTARLKEIKQDPSAKDETALLNQWLALKANEDTLKKQVKEADAALDAAALAHYPTLTPDAVKTLVVNDKWLDQLEARLHAEMDRISQQLTQRVSQLAQRYAQPLPTLTNQTHALEAQVHQHLQRMGYAWT